MEDITKTGRQSNKVITNQINSNFDVEALMKERDEYNALRPSGRAAAHQAASSWEDELVRSNLSCKVMEITLEILYGIETE